MDEKLIFKMRGIIFIVALVLILSLILPLPIPVSRTMEGLAWEEENINYKEVQKVEIKGIYYCYLLRDNVFKGTIGFNKAPKSREFQMSVTVKKPWRNSVHITGAMHMHGIEMEGLFNKVLIRVAPDYGGVYISAPAADRDEAIKVANEVYGQDVFE